MLISSTSNTRFDFAGILSFPTSAPLSRMFFASSGDRNCPFFTPTALPVRAAAEHFEPLLREVGEALGPDGEIVLLGGNHDHELLAGWTDAHLRTKPLPSPVSFVLVPEDKVVKNRVHLDVAPYDCTQQEELARLLALGAREADIGQQDTRWLVLADPEGNEFCVMPALDA